MAPQGGRYLGNALRVNQSLVSLNLRLNRLKDEGGQLLLEGLLETSVLRVLNLAANSLGSSTALTLSRILLSESSHLRDVDLTSNQLGTSDVEILHEVSRKRLVSLEKAQ